MVLLALALQALALTPAPLARLDGDQIVLGRPIGFEYDKDVIRRESFAVLDAVVEILNQHPDLRFEVQGHDDGAREEYYGRRLSDDRARSVMYFLVSKGIDVARLEARGYGSSKPLYDPRSPAGRRKNRRIEFQRL